MLSLLALLFAIAALFQISSLKKRIVQLEHQLRTQSRPEHDSVTTTDSDLAAPQATEQSESIVAPVTLNAESIPTSLAGASLSTFNADSSSRDIEPRERRTPTSEKVDRYLQRLTHNIKQHWLVWAGGMALLIGVAYLMQVISEYIEFTPIMRIGFAFTVSTLVLWLGHQLDKKESQYSEMGFAYIPAVISAAGCMGLYSTVIIGYLLYDFLSPVMSLSAMGAISIVTLSLHVRLGPLMAVLGLIAGYTAPLWFIAETPNPFALAGYISFVAFSGLLLASYAKKSWLYITTLIPFIAWFWIIALDLEQSAVSLWAVCYLPLAMYFILVVPHFGWTANHNHSITWNPKYRLTTWSTLAVVGLMMIAFKDINQFNHLITIIILTLGLASYPLIHRRLSLQDVSAPLIGAIVLMLFTLITLDPELLTQNDSLVMFAFALCALMARTLHYFHTRITQVMAQQIAVVTPPLLCLITWGINAFYDSIDASVWSLYWLAVIASYALASRRLTCINPHLLATLHLVFLSILFALFDGSDLTLLLAAQALVATWQIRRQYLQPAFWAVKVLMSLVIVRMTVSIAWPEFHQGQLDQGGYLWVYGAIATLLYLGLRNIKPISSDLSVWLEGTWLHLSAITVVAQTHYWVIEPNTPWYQFDVNHALLYVCESILMAGVYQYRSRSAQAARVLYQYYAQGLTLLALVMIVLLNTYYSPLFFDVVNGQAWPILNTLALGWLIPAALLLGLPNYKLLPSIIPLSASNLLGFGLAGFWLLLSIRQFWQADSITLWVPTSMAEQITYSIVGVMTGALCTLLWRLPLSSEGEYCWAQRACRRRH